MADKVSYHKGLTPSKVHDDDVEEFLDYIQTFGLIKGAKRGRRASPNTVKLYRAALSWFRIFIEDKPWNDVSREDVEAFVLMVDKKGMARGSQGVALYALQTFFNWRIFTGRMGDKTRLDSLRRYLDNPCVHVVKPTPVKKKRKPWTEEEYRRVRKAAWESSWERNKLRNVLALDFNLDALTRKHEFLAIEWRDVNPKTGEVDLSRLKGKKPEEIDPETDFASLSEHTLQELRKYAIQKLGKGEKLEGRIFDISESSYYGAFKRWCKRAGVEGSPHITRHTRASWEAENGATREELRRLGRWSPNSKAMDRYISPRREKIHALNKARTDSMAARVYKEEV